MWEQAKVQPVEHAAEKFEPSVTSNEGWREELR